MDINAIKKIIDSRSADHNKFVKNAKISERYYENKNDITKDKSPSNNASAIDSENPLRNADNRIPFNWHSFLVNQKISYMFTYPPTFDVYDEKMNEKIIDILGDAYPKEAKTLGKNASNCGKSWLHVWKDDNNDFQYSNVDPKQIIPIYSSDLKKTLIGVLRTYIQVVNSKKCSIYEYWDSKKCYAFMCDETKDISVGLENFNMFLEHNLDTGEEELLNEIEHDFGEVPFIEFNNNDLSTSDLDNVKPLIDVYDKVFSGFVNDIEDIQEIIFVLNNYGGTDLGEFLKGLKKYKTVDMQTEGDDKSGLSTITIDIPVEARNTLLNMTEKQIYVQGQGVNPNPENFANTSGVALKFLYTLLELKSGLMETEFRLGFAKLVRMICKHLNFTPRKINQTWTRNMITNDTETSEIIKNSVGIMSDKTIRKNHPFMEDEVAEEEQIKIEKEEKINDYNNVIPTRGATGES